MSRRTRPAAPPGPCRTAGGARQGSAPVARGMPAEGGGEKHGRKRIARPMRAAGIVGASRRRGTVTTTRRDKESRTGPTPAQGQTLVDRNFSAATPNQLWAADIALDPLRGSAGRRRFPRSGRRARCVQPSDPTGPASAARGQALPGRWRTTCRRNSCWTLSAWQ